MGHDEQRRRRLREERLDRLARSDVEVVRGLVEEHQVGREDPEQGELQAGAFAAGQGPDLLEHVVAPEQEAGEVAACLAGRDGDRLEDRVDHGRARDRRVTQLGEVRRGHLVAERHDAVERRQVAGDRPQERRLAGPVGTDDADPLPALGGEERRRGDRHGLRGLGPVRGERPATGQVADGEVLEPDDDLARADRPADEGLAPQLERPLRRLGGLHGLRPELLEARLVLVHLHVLALAPVALHELDLAGDRVLVGLGLPRRALVALDALAVVRAVVAAEHRQAPVAELPDPRDGRVEERPVVARDEERPGTPAEVLLEPLDRTDVEVVRRLVEEHQVRVADHEPGERGTRLLSAGQRRRGPHPLVAREARAPTAPRPRAGPACSRRGCRSGAGGPRTVAPPA